MNTLTGRRMPLLFAMADAQMVPGLAFAFPDEATGVLVIVARPFESTNVAAALGPHIMSPAHLPLSVLEARVAKALRKAALEPGHLPGTVPLPAGLPVALLPTVVLTLDRDLGAARLEAIGRALRELREEGIVLAGVASEHATPESRELIATLSLLLGAAWDGDRVVELAPRCGSRGFLLESEEADGDDGSSFWSVEPGGELPLHGLEQLRPFLARAGGGDNHGMSTKKASDILITRFDKARLMRLLRGLDAAHENRDEIEDLERELERGTEVESTEVAPDVVTMNSTVRVTDLDANTTHTYTIVFPGDADVDKGRISILSPLGTALLGYRAGDVVTWEMPRGTRRLRIEALVYQPEAAGDFHL